MPRLVFSSTPSFFYPTQDNSKRIRRGTTTQVLSDLSNQRKQSLTLSIARPPSTSGIQQDAAVLYVKVQFQYSRILPIKRRAAPASLFPFLFLGAPRAQASTCSSTSSASSRTTGRTSASASSPSTPGRSAGVFVFYFFPAPDARARARRDFPDDVGAAKKAESYDDAAED